jgi:NAD(P)-dependent dehydrogenase (short-subunit alcohol dehydrogenase family)
MADTENKRLVLVTGATSGIGFAVVKLLLREGYAVLGVGSQESRCETAKSLLLSDFPSAELHFFHANLADQSGVHQLSDDIIAYLLKNPDRRLYCLINNAGAVRDRYMTTAEGYEYQFALNHLAGFCLTYRLRPFLKNGLVLFTGSYSHFHMKIHWKDIMFQHWYNVLLAYKQSKLCNVMTAVEFNRRLATDSIRCFVVDPGLVRTEIGDKGTTGIARFVWSIRKKSGTSADVPALTYAFLLAHPEVNGVYFKDSIAIPYNKEADKQSETTRLFSLSEKLCGISYGDGSIR